jgi:hypothetical protein
MLQTVCNSIHIPLAELGVQIREIQFKHSSLNTADGVAARGQVFRA